MVISMPRGTQDILPEESIKWQYIEEKLREISKNFCYEEIRTPMFESTELFSRGVGGYYGHSSKGNVYFYGQR